MSMTHGDKVISLKVDEEFVNDFDRTLRQAQADGLVELNLSRSEAIRRAMAAAIENPELLADDE